MSLAVDEINTALDLGSFIDRSPTPYHAVEDMVNNLTRISFEILAEDEEWNLVDGKGYIVTRNGSAIVAFVTGSLAVRRSGFKIIGAHTDSPNIRLKPNAPYDNAGYVQLGVEPYGGLLLNSWLNRDLSIAGRVMARTANGGLISRLVNIGGNLLSIPQIAIHLDRDVNEKGVVLNKQTHLPPIIGLSEVGRPSILKIEDLLLDASGLKGCEIVSTDLALYNAEKSAIGGLKNEFIYASRLDNLASCHAALLALSKADSPASTCVFVAYDHEEVGSQTAQGAQSSFLRGVLERIAGDGLKQALARSLCISADMAHAMHPNYPEKHDPRHAPIIGKGPVIKTNVNGRYASTDVSTAFFAELCRRVDVPYQNFVGRSDLGCGTTIGPITASELGICTVDVGNPMLSMHSIREQAGVSDHFAMIKVLTEFFSNEVVIPQIV